MTLRPYRTDDLAAIADLFYRSVHTLCSGDYTKEQLDAWATGHIDEEAWDASFRARHTLVAEENGALLGFADMTKDGYRDRLYVHHEHTGKGVATALVNALDAHCPPPLASAREAAPPAARFTTHASKTARPFFERRGYRVEKEQQVVRCGAVLTNFVMKKTP